MDTTLTNQRIGTGIMEAVAPLQSKRRPMDTTLTNQRIGTGIMKAVALPQSKRGARRLTDLVIMVMVNNGYHETGENVGDLDTIFSGNGTSNQSKQRQSNERVMNGNEKGTVSLETFGRELST